MKFVIAFYILSVLISYFSIRLGFKTKIWHEKERLPALFFMLIPALNLVLSLVTLIQSMFVLVESEKMKGFLYKVFPE